MALWAFTVVRGTRIQMEAQKKTTTHETYYALSLSIITVNDKPSHGAVNVAGGQWWAVVGSVFLRRSN